jgi:hypothetical protein
MHIQCVCVCVCVFVCNTSVTCVCVCVCIASLHSPQIMLHSETENWQTTEQKVTCSLPWRWLNSGCFHVSWKKKNRLNNHCNHCTSCTENKLVQWYHSRCCHRVLDNLSGWEGSALLQPSGSPDDSRSRGTEVRRWSGVIISRDGRIPIMMTVEPSFFLKRNGMLFPFWIIKLNWIELNWIELNSLLSSCL